MTESPLISPFEYLMDQFDPAKGYNRGTTTARSVVENELPQDTSTKRILTLAKTSAHDIIQARSRFLPTNKHYLNWLRSTHFSKDVGVLAKFSEQQKKDFFQEYANFQFSYLKGLGEGLISVNHPLGVPILLASGSNLETSAADKAGEGSWNDILTHAQNMEKGSKIIIPGWKESPHGTYQFVLGEALPKAEHITRNQKNFIWDVNNMDQLTLASRMMVPNPQN